ncbi:MAG: hypothetical protein ACRDFS_02320 [Chloroflexota bacterium]
MPFSIENRLEAVTVQTEVEPIDTQAINWIHDLDQGLKQAKQTNRYVLLDFFSPT